jgi:hypothetical protein
MTQLNPPLPLKTPKGSGWAHFVIDYGPESALLWVVFMEADGACRTVPNPQTRKASRPTRRRIGRSTTIGRAIVPRRGFIPSR